MPEEVKAQLSEASATEDSRNYTRELPSLLNSRIGRPLLSMALAAMLLQGAEADNSWNGNGYNSLPAVLSRQRESWKGVEQHFRNIAPNHSSRSSSWGSSGSSSTEISPELEDTVADLFQPFADLFGVSIARSPRRASVSNYRPQNQRTQNYSWENRYQSSEAYRQQFSRQQAEYARQQREAEELRERERQEFLKRVNELAESERRWYERSWQNPYETCQERPTSFSTWEPQQQFNWYELRARGGMGWARRDPYSALMALDLLMENKVSGDDKLAGEMLSRSLECSLKWYYASVLEVRASKTAAAEEHAMIGLRRAASTPDLSGGQPKALKVLRKIYRNKTTPYGYTLPLDLSTRMGAFASSSDSDDIDKLWLLAMQHRSELPNLDTVHVASVATALKPRLSQLVPESCLALGRLLQAQKDPLCVDYYLRALDFVGDAEQRPWVSAASAYWLCMGQADPKLLDRVPKEKLPVIQSLGREWANKQELLSGIDLHGGQYLLEHMTAFAILSGLADGKPDAKKAYLHAVAAGAFGESSGLVQLATACRLGKNGWKRDDALAMSCVSTFIKQFAPTNKNVFQRQDFAAKVLLLAGLFDADPKSKIPAAHEARAKFYAKAYEYDSTNAFKYASFLVEETPYKNRQEAGRVSGIAEKEAADRVESFRKSDPDLVAISTKILEFIRSWRAKNGLSG